MTSVTASQNSLNFLLRIRAYVEKMRGVFCNTDSEFETRERSVFSAVYSEA
jgi:hypothetical protein